MPLSGVEVSIGRNSFDPPAPTVPVFDINARLYVLHDSGTEAGSGIIQFHALNNHLIVNPSNSGAQPIVTAVLFNAYDAAGGNSVSSTLTTLNVDTERVNTHPDIFVLAADEVQINASGTYVFEYNASYDVSVATRTSARTLMEREAPGGAFTAIPGTLSFGYHRQTTNGEDTHSAKFILDDVSAGDKFRIGGIILAGAAAITQIADGTSLTIRKLA